MTGTSFRRGNVLYVGAPEDVAATVLPSAYRAMRQVTDAFVEFGRAVARDVIPAMERFAEMWRGAR